MFSRGFASGLMSIREESPGRTGRFQGFAEPLAGNVLHDAACPAAQGWDVGSEGKRGGVMSAGVRCWRQLPCSAACSSWTWVLRVLRWVLAKGASSGLGEGLVLSKDIDKN